MLQQQTINGQLNHSGTTIASVTYNMLVYILVPHSYMQEPCQRYFHLEKVQRRASLLALGQRRGEVPYEDRCEALRWSSLSDRIGIFSFSLIECSNIVFELNNLRFCDDFEFQRLPDPPFVLRNRSLTQTQASAMCQKNISLSSFSQPIGFLSVFLGFFFHQAKLVLEWLSDVSQPAVDRSFMFTSLPDMVTYFVTTVFLY